MRSIYSDVVSLCREIERDLYTINVDGQSYIVNKVAWITKYACPKCGTLVNPKYHLRKKTKILVCPRCKKKFLPHQAESYFDEVFEIHAKRKNEMILIRNKNICKTWELSETSINVSDWYPDGKFEYPNGVRFVQHPRIIEKISELFYKRGLAAASKLYNFIEKIWSENLNQGDLLKLAFIASISAATKMLPYSRTSGPSWKIHRYWIPHIRYERNFCDSFLRKLNTLTHFKKQLKAFVRNYRFFTSYDSSDINLDTSKKMIYVFRADARGLNLQTKFDVIIIDPPHFDEINYFELTYMWQLWLKGRFNDTRFSDFEFWKKEIMVNRKIGKGLSEYVQEIKNIFIKYSSMLSSGGSLFLILHHKDNGILNEIFNQLQGCTSNLSVIQNELSVPSSMKGILKKKKQYVYFITTRNLNA